MVVQRHLWTDWGWEQWTFSSQEVLYAIARICYRPSVYLSDGCITEQESHAVAGKPRDAAVNSDRYRVRVCWHFAGAKSAGVLGQFSAQYKSDLHVLLRLTYLLACLLHTVITICVVFNAGLSRSVRMSLIVISFDQFWIWIWIIIANLLRDISAMDSFICLDNILLFISLC